MSDILTPQIVETMGTKYAVLGIGSYSLLVRFRMRGLIVECSVPKWSGLSDLLEKIEEVSLVVIKGSDKDLNWIFVRGQGRIIENQDWNNLLPSEHELVGPEDLYHLLQIEPNRIELFDEQRGWGFRQTADFITGN